VIATAGSDEKVAWAGSRERCRRGDNHAWEDVLEKTRGIAGEGGVEVVLDTVGAYTSGEPQAGRPRRAVVVLVNVALEESVIDTPATSTRRT
jgi:NADPH-dependent curcumin reductase CurA